MGLSSRQEVSFPREADLVMKLQKQARRLPHGFGYVYVAREGALGPRLADLVVCGFRKKPRTTGAIMSLTKLSFPELRILSETVDGPTRVSTIARRLSALDDVVEKALMRLERLELVVHRPGTWTASEWSEALPQATWLIEAKLRDWRTAIKQATYYREFADAAFVALPPYSRDRAKAARSACAAVGVGLIEVHPGERGRAKVVERAARAGSSPRRAMFRLHLLRTYLNERS